MKRPFCHSDPAFGGEESNKLGISQIEIPRPARDVNRMVHIRGKSQNDMFPQGRHRCYVSLSALTFDRPAKRH